MELLILIAALKRASALAIVRKQWMNASALCREGMWFLLTLLVQIGTTLKKAGAAMSFTRPLFNEVAIRDQR